MIRYIELYPSDDIAFNSGRITKVHVNEGSSIEIGSLLFTVDAQGKEVEVSSTAAGKIQEMLIFEGEIIHAQSSLLLLETIVDDPITESPATQEIGLQPNKKELTRSEQTNKLNKATEKNIMNEIKVPDLGGADGVEVIDILVSVGDTVQVEDALMTVESDKASMDIPAPINGKIEEITIKVGDTISEGDVIFRVLGEFNSTSKEALTTDTRQETNNENAEHAAEKPDSNQTEQSQEIQIAVPDLGGADEVEVIDLLIAIGDTIEKNQAIITVESDKASMDVPTPHAGTVSAINVSIGDKVNEGDNIIVINSATQEAASSKIPSKPVEEKKQATSPIPTSQPENNTTLADMNTPAPDIAQTSTGTSHASPSVRRLARELGVNLSHVTGSARKKRITKSDVKKFAKEIISSRSNSNNQDKQVTHSENGIPEIPAQDFSKFGEIELQPLNKIKRVTANHLHRSWLNIPHVTHNDESNIASLEEFRKTLNAENEAAKNNIKLSPLAFIVKAVIKALQTFPQFNSSLENGGKNLILKNYYNIGIAVETPNGLVVPVIKNADKLNVTEIAQAMGDIAKKARDGKLTANDMQGGTFTISSLGGIGGTHFTPIVNAPEVAILGVSRTKIQPIWNGKEFEPAPILPLSLSYDHRVIDGAEAARFTRHIATALEDIRRLTV